MECDYFPGFEGWLDRQLSSADFHYVLGSVHPQLAEFRERYWRGDAVEFQLAYFSLLAEAAETRLFDCLAHPDFIKNETPDDWHIATIMDDIRRALDRIATAGVAMELNTSGTIKVIRELSPFPEMLVEMRQRSIPVTIGSDAHQPQRVGDGFDAALALLEECGYESVSFFVERQRQDVRIRDALQSRESRVESPEV